jgi:hypothetical protein
MESVTPWHQVGRLVIAAFAWLAWPVQQPAHSADFLDPQDAFKFSAAVADGGKAVDAHFTIADGYSRSALASAQAMACSLARRNFHPARSSSTGLSTGSS